MSDTEEPITPDKSMYPMYDPTNYPVGVDQFLRSLPLERRAETLEVIAQLHFRDTEEQAMVASKIREMREIPNVLYKYMPRQRLQDGAPNHVAYDSA